MAAEGIGSLSYPVRGPVILKYLGQLGLMVAALTLAPLVASLLFGEYGISGRYVLVIFILVVIGIPLSRLSSPSSLQTNEALTITTLVFLFSPLFMTYPLMGAGLQFTDAFFEAMSAITTTGLSTLPSIEDKPRSFLFARAWMQWYGGLGIAALSVALLMGQGIIAKRMVETAPGETLVTTTKIHARRVLACYVSLTALGIGLLWSMKIDLFYAVTLALAAVSTGGFSPFNNSLAHLQSYPAATCVILLSFCGAVSLPLYYNTYRHGWKKLVADVELPSLVMLCAVGSLLVGVSLGVQKGWGWPEAAMHGIWQFLSAQTTTGFSTIPIQELDQTSKAFMMVSMAVGGSVGSTSGGIKILRFLIVLHLVRLLLQRACAPPHAVIEPKLGDRHLEQDDIIRALHLIIVFGALAFISWLCFLSMGYDPMDSLFEVVSALGTVGLSTGITGHDLPSWLKGVLCFDMLAGRLEIIALLVTLYPRTWVGRKGMVP